MGVTESLAHLIVETRYADLPADVVEAAKVVVLDGVGVTLAGSREPLARILMGHVEAMGGTPACSVVGGGFRTSPVSAAFLNGVFCHALDYEPMWHPATHPTSPTLPVLLALAESRGFSGWQVVEGLVVAFEVQGRLRVASATMDMRGFHPPGVVGVMGAAVAGAKMLGLDPRGTRIALGIAASRAGGVSANTGTMTKSTHCGNAASRGLEAALLAERGFTAHEDVLEVPRGYVECLFGQGFDLDAVVTDFGRPFRLVDPGIAPP